jgi:hypothetical protein
MTAVVAQCVNNAAHRSVRAPRKGTGLILCARLEAASIGEGRFTL